jgi:hypothetical protein
LSVRIHSGFDRAIGRAEALDGDIRAQPPNSTDYDRIKDAVRRLQSAGHPDIANRLTRWGNVLVLGLIVFLGALIAIRNEWDLAYTNAGISADFWAFFALLVIEIGIVALGFLENASIARRSAEQLDEFLAYRFVRCEQARLHGEHLGGAALVSALRSTSDEYGSLADTVPAWAYAKARAGILSIRVALLEEHRDADMLASLWFHTGMRRLAEACSDSPKNLDWVNAFSQNLLRAGQFDDAQKHVRWITERSPHQDVRAGALNNLSVLLLLASGVTKGVLASFEAICRHGWVCSELCHNLAEVYRLFGKDEKAEHFRKISTYLEPDYAAIKLDLQKTRKPLPWWLQAEVRPRQPRGAGQWKFYFDEPGEWLHRWLLVPGNPDAPESWIGLWNAQGRTTAEQNAVRKRIAFVV